MVVDSLILKKCCYGARLLTIVHMSDRSLALFKANFIMVVETYKTNQLTYNQLDYNHIFRENQMKQGCVHVIKIWTYHHLSYHWFSRMTTTYNHELELPIA